MHWWQQLPFSSTTKSQTAGDILITESDSATAGSLSSRRKLRQKDVDEWSRSSSAIAQPLPLPELQVKLVPSRSLNVPLPSPSPDARRSRRERGCSLERDSRKAEAHGLHHHLKRLVGDNRRTSAEEGEFGLCRKSAVKQNGEESTSSVSSPPRSDIYHEIPHTQLSYNNGMPSNKIFALRVEDMIRAVASKISHANVHTLPLPPGPTSSTSHLSGATMSLSPTPPLKHSSPISQIVGKPQLMPIRSQWQKGKLIGRGTFGSVYVASNRKTGALCAMKEVEILPHDVKSQESMRQLEQEIKVLSKLKHPNIVQYYGSEVVGDKFYIYLEYVHPGSINKFIHDHCAAISESVVRNFTRHILCGLAYLHSTKTIHR